MEPNSQSLEYITWKSPSRLFKKRDKDFFRNIAAIVFLLLVILVFAREFSLILAVLSISFLVYVFSTIPPEDVTHRITNRGIESGGHFYPWDSLRDFWFETQWDQTMMVIVPVQGTRIIILLGTTPKQTMKDILGRFMTFKEEPQKTVVDSAASWLAKKVPLEKTP